MDAKETNDKTKSKKATDSTEMAEAAPATERPAEAAAEATPVQNTPKKRGRPRKVETDAPPEKKWKDFRGRPRKNADPEELAERARQKEEKQRIILEKREARLERQRKKKEEEERRREEKRRLKLEKGKKKQADESAAGSSESNRTKHKKANAPPPTTANANANGNGSASGATAAPVSREVRLNVSSVLPVPVKSTVIPKIPITHLHGVDRENYLPSRGSSLSIGTCNGNEDATILLTKVKTFHSMMSDQTAERGSESSDEVVRRGVILSVGGGVTALDWCPSPNQQNQFLAVSCARNLCTLHSVYVPECQKNCLQIWRITGMEKNASETDVVYGSSLSTPLSAAMSFCIASELDGASALAWCPDGWISKSEGNMGRMGLLAAVHESGDICVYSVPHEEDTNSRAQSNTQSETPNCIRLKFQSMSTSAKKPTCISWSKDPSRRFLAAGYSDGHVACWKVEDNIEGPNSAIFLGRITPDHIVSIDFDPFCPYVFATASLNTNFLKLWDMRIGPTYLSTCAVAGHMWPNQIMWSKPDWIMYSTAEGCICYADFGKKTGSSRQYPISPDSVRCFHYQKELDSIVCGDDGGRVIIVHCSKMKGKSRQDTGTISRAYRIHLNSQKFESIESDKSSSEQGNESDLDCFSILLEDDCDEIDPKSSSSTSHPWRGGDNPVDIRKRLLSSVCALKWNPNSQFRSWVAVGTGAGIVEILPLFNK